MNGSPDFFVGWVAAPPRALRRFLTLVAGGVLAGAVALGIGLGFAADDPAGAGFSLGASPFPALVLEDRLTGTLTVEPYPVLHLPPRPKAAAGPGAAARGRGQGGGGRCRGDGRAGGRAGRLCAAPRRHRDAGHR